MPGGEADESIFGLAMTAFDGSKYNLFYVPSNRCETSDVEVHFRAEIVNVYDPFEVEWAMAIRMKARSDIVITKLKRRYSVTYLLMSLRLSKK